MQFNSAKRKMTLPAVAGAALSLVTAAAPALAGTANIRAGADGPDFTCPANRLCVFQGDDLNGYEHSFTSSTGTVNLTNYGFTIPWGGFNNGLSVRVFFGSDCYNAGVRLADPGGARYQETLRVGTTNDSC